MIQMRVTERTSTASLSDIFSFFLSGHCGPQLSAFVKVFDQENGCYSHDDKTNQSRNRKWNYEGDDIKTGLILPGVVDDHGPIGHRGSNHCETNGKNPWHSTGYLVDDHPCNQAYDGSSCEDALYLKWQKKKKLNRNNNKKIKQRKCVLSYKLKYLPQKVYSMGPKLKVWPTCGGQGKDNSSRVKQYHRKRIIRLFIAIIVLANTNHVKRIFAWKTKHPVGAMRSKSCLPITGPWWLSLDKLSTPWPS